MRRLNVKFLLCLVVPLILVASGVHLLWAVNVERSTKHILEKAKSAMDEGDIDRALQHYTRYLQQNPRDVDEICAAALAAADIFEQSKNPTQREVRSAYEFMSRAVRKVPERNDIRRRLVLLMVKANVNDEARKHVEYLDASGKSDPEMDYSYAVCAGRMKDYKPAIERLNRIVGFDSRQGNFERHKAGDPSMLDAYRLLALLHRDDRKQADRILDEMVAANSESAEAHLILGRHLRSTNATGDRKDRDARQELAKKHLRRAMELEGSDPDILLENVVIAISAGEHSEAQKILDEAEYLHPQDHRVARFKGLLAIAKNDPKGALAEYEKGLERIPDSHQLIWYLYEMQSQAGDYDAAKATIQRMKKMEKFPAVRIELAEAQAMFMDRQWKEAILLLEKVRPALKGDVDLTVSTNMLLAQCYNRLGKVDSEMNAYKRALAASPSLLMAVRGSITALVRLEQYEDAYQSLREARFSLGSQTFDSDEQLVRLYYDVVFKLHRQQPDSKPLAAEFELVQKLIMTPTSEKAEDGDEDPVLKVVVTVNRLAKEDKFKEALSLLEKSLRKVPNNHHLQALYVDIHRQKYNPERTLTRLLTMIEKGDLGFSDNAFSRTVRAQLISTVNDPGASDELAALEVGIEKFDKSQQFNLWKALGAAYYRVPPRNFDAVKRCWFNALNVHPNRIELCEQLFDLARQQNDDLGLISVMAHVDKAYGESSPESMYFHGKQLLWNYQRDSTDKDSLESASDISQRMTELRPEWHLSALLDAEVNDLQKRPEAAIRAYQNALKLGPPRASAVQRLVVLLTEEGKFGDARVELAKINPLPQELKRYQVLLEAMSGDPDKALRALQDAIPPASTNPDDWIWVGQIYTHLKRPKEAGQAFRQAVTVGTSYARTWLTMVEFLVRTGQSANAENYVRNSENHLAVDQAPLALAKAYALLGHREMAELHFESAMVSSGDDPATIRSVAMYYYDTGQVAKAEQYIKRLLRITDSSGPSASPHAIWARRSLARAMGREEDYGRFVTAMAILDANRVDGRLSLVDERIKAELMGRREEPQFRERAVQILERLNNQNVALSAEERLVLARLYDKSDRSVQAVEIMTGLVSETGDKPNPDFLAAFSQMLLDRKEYGRANTWIEKLAKIEPKMLRTVRLQARAAMGFNNPDEARRLINEGLQDDRTSANGGQILQAALLMEEFGLNTDAAEKFSEFIKLRPDRFFMYAGFLARSGQVDKTFELCASKESEETVGTICRIGMLAFLEYPEKSIPHFSTLQKWFDAAIAQDPGDVTLSMNWASVLHAMGKSDDAQSVLKAALKADLSRRERGILVNNLAYLNATRGNVDADTIRLVETAVELIGPSRDVLDSRAMIHLAQGNCEKAVKDLENATMFGTDSGILYFHLALAYQCEDDREAAKRTMEKAKAVDFAPRRLSTIEREKYHELASWLAL